MPIGRSSDPDRDRPHSSLPLSRLATLAISGSDRILELVAQWTTVILGLVRTRHTRLQPRFPDVVEPSRGWSGLG